jgi:glycosyltransferase involved in cell wall biosynthesis
LPIAPAIILKLIREFNQHDLIAVHYPFPLADIGLLFCFSRKPLIIHWHSNIVAQRYLRWLVAPFSFLMLWRARAIVVTDQAMVNNSLLLRMFSKKCQRIPYGIESLPDRHEQTAVPEYLVMVGRHVSYKGMNVAMHALLHCDARLRIIGDGPLFSRHQQLARELGLEDRVEFIRYADDTMVSDSIAKSLGLVVSSNLESEAFALVQLEAMRLGKPVINTNLKSAVPTVARDNREGITVEPNDPVQLGRAMQRLVSDHDLAERLGTAGRARFQAQFESTSFKKAISDLYQSIQQSHGA